MKELMTDFQLSRSQFLVKCHCLIEDRCKECWIYLTSDSTDNLFPFWKKEIFKKCTITYLCCESFWSVDGIVKHSSWPWKKRTTCPPRRYPEKEAHLQAKTLTMNEWTPPWKFKKPKTQVKSIFQIFTHN